MKVEDLFSDILYTNENPAVIKTEKIFKEGNKVKRISESKSYDLISNDILSELRTCKKTEVEFYQKGILKLFRKYKNIIDISKILRDISNNNYKFITMNKKTGEKLFETGIIRNNDTTLHNLYTNEKLNDDEIIFGDKISNCISNSKTGEYYFDKSSIVILCLT